MAYTVANTFASTFYINPHVTHNQGEDKPPNWSYDCENVRNTRGAKESEFATEYAIILPLFCHYFATMLFPDKMRGLGTRGMRSPRSARPAHIRSKDVVQIDAKGASNESSTTTQRNFHVRPRCHRTLPGDPRSLHSALPLHRKLQCERGDASAASSVLTASFSTAASSSGPGTCSCPACSASAPLASAPAAAMGTTDQGPMAEKG